MCDDGTLYHWGKRWEPDFERPVLEASREMTMTPHKSGRSGGRRKCGVHAVGLLSWEGEGLWLHCGGSYVVGQTVYVGHERVWSDSSSRGTLSSRNPADYFVSTPTEVAFGDGERTLKVAVGLEFIAVQRTSGTSSRVSWAGRFSDGHLRNTDARPSDLRVVSELDGMKLASLTAGAFHCCALRDEGSLYVFGDEYGADESNGNLLGLGPRNETSVTPGPRWHRATRVSSLPPVTSVAASTYSTVAIATDGRCYSWGDCDGGALGRSSGEQRRAGCAGRFERRAPARCAAPAPARAWATTSYRLARTRTAPWSRPRAASGAAARGNQSATRRGAKFFVAGVPALIGDDAADSRGAQARRCSRRAKRGGARSDVPPAALDGWRARAPMGRFAALAATACISGRANQSTVRSRTARGGGASSVRRAAGRGPASAFLDAGGSSSCRPSDDRAREGRHIGHPSDRVATSLSSEANCDTAIAPSRGS